MKILSDAIKENESLLRLNLSKNNLKNESFDSIIEMMDNHVYLRELYLHWNNFTGKGAKKWFEYLANDNKLKVLDLSWNDIG